MPTFITPASPNITNVTRSLANTDELIPLAARVSTPDPRPNLPRSIKEFENGDSRDNLAWIRQAFMLNTLTSTDITMQDMARRIATTAAWKYTDTTLGGNWAINAPPQFTPFADITMGGDRKLRNAVKRTTRTTTGGYGMGRFYSEVIDDNAQVVTMSFGVQAYNSLTSFFGNFYDPEMSLLVRTGRSTGAFFTAGKFTGALLAVPFYPLILGSKIIRSLIDIPSTKFNYFKPTMPVYWNAVNTIVNGITANIGIHYRQLSKAQKLMYNDPTGDAAGIVNGRSGLESQIASLHAILPDVYMSYDSGDGKTVGGIDVYAVASRAQRLATQHVELVKEALKEAASEKELKQRVVQALSGNLAPKKVEHPYLSSKLNAYLAGPGGKSEGHTGTSNEMLAADAKPVPGSKASQKGNTATALDKGYPSDGSKNPNDGKGDAGKSTTTSKTSTPDATTDDKSLWGRFSTWWSDYIDGLSGTLHDGSNYVTFRTDFGGSIGESFSNSMRESDIQQKINSMSSNARNASHDFANGNIVGGAVGKILEASLNSVKGFVMGALDSVQMSGLAALAGAAYVDIPRMYDSSEVTLPSQTFTIELRSWSGHRISLLQNIYIPLACLLAGAMPRSTGPESFNGPFSCQLFAKGRMQIRNGLITELSITRGTGNVGWTPEMLPLGVDISFTVTDYSTVMHMPIIAASGFLDKATLAVGQGVGEAIGGEAGGKAGERVATALSPGTYQDDSIFSDYLGILSGLSWQDQVYPIRKWSIARDRQQLDWETFKSPYHTATWFSGTLPGRLWNGIAYGTDRP